MFLHPALRRTYSLWNMVVVYDVFVVWILANNRSDIITCFDNGVQVFPIYLIQANLVGVLPWIFAYGC